MSSADIGTPPPSEGGGVPQILLETVMLGPAELLALLTRLEIAYTVHEHPPVMTVAESAAIHAHIPALACKCLFLTSKGRQLWLVALPACMRTDLKSLAREMGCPRLSFASLQEMRKRLGVLPGAVTLFGAVNDTENAVRVAVEESLLQAARVSFHPLVNTATVCLSPEHMLYFCRRTGHEPLIVRGVGAEG